MISLEKTTVHFTIASFKTAKPLLVPGGQALRLLSLWAGCMQQHRGAFVQLGRRIQQGKELLGLFWLQMWAVLLQKRLEWGARGGAGPCGRELGAVTPNLILHFTQVLAAPCQAPAAVVSPAQRGRGAQPQSFQPDTPTVLKTKLKRWRGSLLWLKPSVQQELEVTELRVTR